VSEDPGAVRIERRGRVTTVVLSRPAVRNAIDSATASELSDAFRRFDADNAAAVGVLWGDHGTFCSGADLKQIAAGNPNRVALDGDGPLGFSRLRLSKPVIAAISGHAVAGGFELALWCDLRIMEEDGVVGMFNRRFGIPLIDGGTVHLPRLIGLSRALDLILTGRPVNAPEALATGLVHRVVPKGTSREAAESLAAQIAGFPQGALNADRRSALEQFGYSVDTALENELRGAMEAVEGWKPNAEFERFVQKKKIGS
jgi:enoyl-CoA hydratase